MIVTSQVKTPLVGFAMVLSSACCLPAIQVVVMTNHADVDVLMFLLVLGYRLTGRQLGRVDITGRHEFQKGAQAANHEPGGSFAVPHYTDRIHKQIGQRRVGQTIAFSRESGAVLCCACLASPHASGCHFLSAPN